MAHFLSIVNFPPAPKLDNQGRLDHSLATGAEVRGEALPKGDPVSCTACDAMGSCRRCGGRGKRFGRRCAECNGSGTCSVCGGPGYVWVEEPVAERAG